MKSIWGVAALGTTSAALATVYTLHSNDFCISKFRKTTDLEMFSAAMMQPFSYLSEDTDIPLLRRVQAANESRTNAPVEGTRIVISTSGVDQNPWLKHREERKLEIAHFLKNPENVVRCCARVDRTADNIGKIGFFDILNGRSRKAIRIRMDVAIADAASFDPPVRWKAEGFVVTDAFPLKIVGPIVQQREEYGYFDLDVCGKVKPAYD